LFGAPQTPAQAPFGAPAAGGFGPQAGGFGGFGGAAAGAPGTMSVKFQATPLQEQGATAPLHFQVITAMTQYSAKSVEELRYEVCLFHPHAQCCVST
jgi:hypothetical protein